MYKLVPGWLMNTAFIALVLSVIIVPLSVSVKILVGAMGVEAAMHLILWVGFFAVVVLFLCGLYKIIRTA